MPAPVDISKKSVCLPTAQQIDRYGDLHQKVLLFAPVLEEHELLKKQIEAGLVSKPGELPATVEGQRYQLQLTARRRERKIINTMAVYNRLKKLLGIKGFLALITIPLCEAIDKHIPKSEHTGILVDEQTGSRSITVVPLRPAAA